MRDKKFMGVVVENKINIGDVLTLIGIFGAIVAISFGVWRELYDRTSKNESRIVVVENDIDNIQLQARRDRNDIREDLKDIKEAIRDVSHILNNKEDKRINKG